MAFARAVYGPGRQCRRVWRRAWRRRSAAAASCTSGRRCACGGACRWTGGPGRLDTARQSVSPESPPSLLSSAEGKPPATPAPAAEATEAKADTAAPAGQDAKPAEAQSLPKDSAAKDAKAETDPAPKDATPKEAPKAEAPAPLSITDLSLPDGANAEAEEAKTFVDLINNGELSAKDRGQGLLDLHKKEIERVHRELTAHQRKVWDDLNAGWRDDLRNDREIGGNRLHTNLSKAKGMIEEFSSPEDAAALLRHVDNNGMGNYPPFIRLLVRLADQLNVFEDGMLVSNPAPVRPQRASGSRGWYDKSIDRVE